MGAAYNNERVKRRLKRKEEGEKCEVESSILPKNYIRIISGSLMMILAHLHNRSNYLAATPTSPSILSYSR